MTFFSFRWNTVIYQRIEECVELIFDGPSVMSYADCSLGASLERTVFLPDISGNSIAVSFNDLLPCADRCGPRGRQELLVVDHSTARTLCLCDRQQKVQMRFYSYVAGFNKIPDLGVRPIVK